MFHTHRLYNRSGYTLPPPPSLRLNVQLIGLFSLCGPCTLEIVQCRRNISLLPVLFFSRYCQGVRKERYIWTCEST